NLRLRQFYFVERAAHAELPRRLAAWTVVAAIVGVAPIRNRVELPRARHRGEQRIQLWLAVVTMVGRIRSVFEPLELVTLDDLVAESELFRRATRQLALT